MAGRRMTNPRTCSAERASAAKVAPDSAVGRPLANAEAIPWRRWLRRRGRRRWGGLWRWLRRRGRRRWGGLWRWSRLWPRRRWCWTCALLLADTIVAVPHELAIACGGLVVEGASSKYTFVVAPQASIASAISIIIRSIAECAGAFRIWAGRRRGHVSRRWGGITSNVELLVGVCRRQSRDRVCPRIGQ